MVWKHISTSFRVWVKDKSLASDCSPFSSFQWLFRLLWFWHDHVRSSEKSQTFPHTWGLDIPVSFYAVACLHAVVMVILPPVSPALYSLSSIQQSVQLRKGIFLYLAPFPRVSIWPKLQCLGAKQRHFYHCQLQPPEKNVILNNEQYIVNKWSRHLIIISWFQEQRQGFFYSS